MLNISLGLLRVCLDVWECRCWCAIILCAGPLVAIDRLVKAQWAMLRRFKSACTTKGDSLFELLTRTT